MHKKSLWIVVEIIIIVLVTLIIWFNLPESEQKAPGMGYPLDFVSDVNE